MKRLFSSITVLITLSLVGIIIMQVSWLKNLIKLKEDQVKQNIDNVYQNLSDEFGQRREQLIKEASRDYGTLFSPRGFFEPLKAVSIGAKISSSEIEKIINSAFEKAGLGKMKYEYAFFRGC
ncbi:hypothetical protein [Niabella hibiscisoli]|uniref:hypothetical protein n=1 Tax=Niabella hibiscisoli TaxID=1825928 RepID=UPI001F0F4C26|nr:hypothetical protein [Niabella hibiscisoli]MCH5717645.1 hypothetical protein [Niabella hibiscisoli]